MRNPFPSSSSVRATIPSTIPNMAGIAVQQKMMYRIPETNLLA